MKDNRGNHQQSPGQVANTENYQPGITDPDFFEKDFENINFPSVSKDFVEPGDNIESLLMRTVVKKTAPPDPQLVVRFLARCKKYQDTRHEQMLKNLLSISVSIDGRSRLELLMAKTNILATNVLGMFLGSMGKREKKDQPPQVYINNKRRDEETDEP
jgi:hypothetical protein